MSTETEQQPQDVELDETADANEPDDESAGRRRRDAAGEAKRYRTQLRDTEQQRDALAERLTRFQTAEVHRLAADALADPADLFVFGTTMDDLLDESGDLDPQAVAAAVEELVKQRPHLSGRPRRRAPAPDPSQGAPGKTRASWSGVLATR